METLIPFMHGKISHNVELHSRFVGGSFLFFFLFECGKFIYLKDNRNERGKNKEEMGVCKGEGRGEFIRKVKDNRLLNCLEINFIIE